MNQFTGTERFSIRRRLGSGGFGVVYEAFDYERQTLVALKLPHDSGARDLSRFKQTFRALAEIAHPNLVNLFEVRSQGPEWFFTMELVDGRTFYEFLCPDRLPPRDFGPVRGLMAQLGEGLWALHQAGRLHGDLKPSHVRIDQGGRLVLLDYGFGTDGARGAAPAARSQATQAYLAPERIGGHAPTEASDWYSAGVMLYQVLTGALPFPGDTFSTQVDKLRGDPPPPELLAPRTPADLSALCMDLLMRKPALRPPGARILERLGVAAAPVAPAPAPLRRLRTSRLLLARKAELATLGKAFETSQRGRTVVAFVQGDSGMGKSYLVRRFMRRLRREEPGLVLLAGRCSEEGLVPYQAMESLMEDLADHLGRLPPQKAAILFPRDLQFLARLFPVLLKMDAIAQGSRGGTLSPDPQELRRRAFGALRELLMRLGARYPLVLVIEDLQWADLDSTVLLANLLRGPDPPAMLAMFSCRPVAAGQAPGLSALQERLAEEGTEVVEIAVGQLPQAEGQALALALLGSGRPDGAAEAAWIAQESGGSPYFIGELCRQLRSGAPVPERPEERTLDAYLRSRVGALPEASRQVLETLSLAGRPVSWEVLRTACGAGPGGLERLVPLRAGHLIRAWGGRHLLLEPYHDRIRKSVLLDLPEARARQLHRALAEAMEQAPAADAQALSLHFQAAGDLAKAGQYARLAAERAVAGLAFVRAAELFRRVLELTRPEGLAQVELLVELGDALASAGLGSQAAEVYLQALPLASPRDSLRLRRRASEEYFRSGHFDQGEAALDGVMASIGMRLAKSAWSARLAEAGCRLRLRARGYGFTERVEGLIPRVDLDRIDICWAAAMGLGPVDHLRGGEFQARHLLLALRAGEPFRVVRALAMETIYLSHRGTRSLRATQRLQDTTTALAERIGHPNPVSRALVAAGTSALMQGRWKPAVELLDRAASLLKENCTALDFELHLAQYHALLGRQQMGNLRELEVRLSARLQAAQDKGDLLASTNLRTGIAPGVHLAHDEPGRALRELQQTIGEWSSAGFHLQHYNALVSTVAILLYDGLPDLAMAELAGHWRDLRGARLLEMQSILITCLELRARTALAMVLKDPREPRERRALLRLASRAIRRIEAEGVGYGEALALRLQALEALALERPDEAGALLFQAEQAFQACDMVLHAMVVRHRRGRLEGPSGAEQVEAAEAWMRGQRIVNLPRFVAMHLPG